MLVARPADLRGCAVHVIEMAISSYIEDLKECGVVNVISPVTITVGGKSNLTTLFNAFKNGVFISKHGYDIALERGSKQSKGSRILWDNGLITEIWNNPWDSDIHRRFALPGTVKEFIDELKLLDPSLAVKIVVSEGCISFPECKIEDGEIVIGELN